MTAIAPVITIDGPSGAGKGSTCGNGGSIAVASVIQARSTAYWRRESYITMLMSLRDALVPLAHILMCVLSQQRRQP